MSETVEERHIRLANAARATNGLPAFTASQADRYLRSVRAFKRLGPPTVDSVARAATLTLSEQERNP